MDHQYSTPALKPDELTLHLIASGVIQLSERVTKGDGIRYPYPVAMQRGLDRLTASRLRRGQKPPQGIMELLAWCRESLASWELDIPAEAVGYDDRLLHGNLPTDTCDSWASIGPNIEDDLTERQFMKGVFEICRSQSNPALYTDFRLALVSSTNRVLTKLNFTKMAGKTKFTKLHDTTDDKMKHCGHV